MQTEMSKEAVEKLKYAYSWLDHDSDGTVSLLDLKQSCCIDEEDARGLFNLLASSSEASISFQTFSKAVLNNPELLNRFPSKPSLSPTQMIIQKITDILSLPQITSEVIIDCIYKEIHIDKHPKEKIIQTSVYLLEWIKEVNELNEKILAENSSKLLEYRVYQEVLKNDRERAQCSLESLIKEHICLETTFKLLQEENLKLKHELREKNLRLAELESQQEAAAQSIEDLKSEVRKKDKEINEFIRKMKVTSNLNAINSVNTNKNIKTPKHEIMSQFRYESAFTPRFIGKDLFFDMDADAIKDQVIKNLKNQLIEGYSKIQGLEQQISEVKYQNKEYIEKIKDLSTRNYCVDEEEDESCKYETLESLRDEIVKVDMDCSRNLYPFRLNKSFAEAAVQTEEISIGKKKRLSCFSFFN